MSKRMYIFAAAGMASLVLLVLVSLPVSRETTATPFFLEDGSTGVVRLIIPETLRQHDWTAIELDVTFDKVNPSDQNVKIKTILQTANLEVKPAGEVSAVIPINGTAPFKWQIRSTGLGVQLATLWCFREGVEGQTLILARELEFDVRSFLGISFQFTRWILGMSVVLCALLTFHSIKNRKNQAVSE